MTATPDPSIEATGNAKPAATPRVQRQAMDEFPFQDEFDEEMRAARARLALQVGDIYEDCSYHPVLCVSVSYEEDDIQGISLVDGSFPRSCSLRHCGVRKLTVQEAWQIRRDGPSERAVRDAIAVACRWWRD